MDHKPGSGKKCTARTDQNIYSVEELVLSALDTKHLDKLCKRLEFPKCQCIGL